MLIVQKYHSIHEIDPEFIPSIELLLQEDMASFGTLIQRHDGAPDSDVFTYFLFFGTTQNTPIGFAQLRLRNLAGKNLVPWHKKMSFWNKDHEHWKQASWLVGDGTSGLAVFDVRFSRSGKEKLQELIQEYEMRKDVVAHEVYCLKGLQDFSLKATPHATWSKEFYVLEPLTKAHKSYQDYLASLSSDIQSDIKNSWKALHKNIQIELGDYPSPHEAPKTLPIPSEQLETWDKWGAQVLTFEKGLTVLGCLLVLRGKNGNIFFEPYPFETQGDPLVSDEIYTQYALFKFFEMTEARKCHLMKFGAKLIFEDKNDFTFFKEQGFGLKTIVRHYQSHQKELHSPL